MMLGQSMLLSLALAGTPAVEPPASAACPAPSRQAPQYPISMMRSNVSGTVMVKARIDDCGRVVEPEVVGSSGHAALDQAAMDTVLLWVLNQAERDQVGQGWVNLPVNFGGVRTLVPKKVDWPRSHRRPVYLPDEQAFGFPSIEAYFAAGPGRSEPLLQQPYRSVTQKSGVRTSTSIQQDRDDPMVYWLAYSLQIPPAADAPRGTSPQVRSVAIARYRLVQEEGRPVVRVAILCEETPEACAQLSEFLMQGLPIAKPPRA